jgi:hypothetical protein
LVPELRAEAGALEPHRRFGNWLATELIHLCFGYRYTELPPFRAIRTDALGQLGVRDRDYGWLSKCKSRRCGINRGS